MRSRSGSRAETLLGTVRFINKVPEQDGDVFRTKGSEFWRRVVKAEYKKKLLTEDQAKSDSEAGRPENGGRSIVCPKSVRDYAAGYH
ncbi:hypothetical protein BJX99DRAFT_231034 [Aspergillus californicus]